jgi:hypothetical protein
MATGQTRQNLGHTSGEDVDNWMRAREPMGEGWTTFRCILGGAVCEMQKSARYFQF